MSEKVKQAMDTIRKAMEDDNPSEQGSYAHAWHCNLAMAFYDAMDDNCIDDSCKIVWANDAASAFMKVAFGVDTSA